MNDMICNKLKDAVISDSLISSEKSFEILSPLFGDSLSMSGILINVLESLPDVFDDEPALPINYDVFVENFYTVLKIALENGLNPNEVVPYEDGSGGDNIMWAVVGIIRHSDLSPEIIKLLLEYGGDPDTSMDFLTLFFPQQMSSFSQTARS